MAEDRPCLLMMAMYCQPGSTVAAHSNFVGSGKGLGMKAHDFNTVWACARCHDALDSGHRSYDEKYTAFHKAHIRQLDAWKKIAEDPQEKEKYRKAAQWAIDHLEGKK